MPSITLPIFPLNVVLFPGTTLPLHLFEPRYRQLLTDVRAGDGRFGILCTIPGTPERELPAGRGGAVAQVTHAEVLPDGRADILVTGQERFTLTAFVDHAAPYHVATVERFSDDPVVHPVALAVAADDVAAHFRRVASAVHVLNDDPAPPPALSDDPVQLVWQIAAMIDIDTDTRYRLLMARDAAARTTMIDAVLRKALPDLELRAAMHQNRS